MELHVFQEHLPWFVKPDSACWVCERQFLCPMEAIRHFKKAGHEGGFEDGRVGVWGEKMKGFIVHVAGFRGWKSWGETTKGMGELWEERFREGRELGQREGYLGRIFEDYLGHERGAMSLYPLRGVGALCNWRVLVVMMGRGLSLKLEEELIKGETGVELGREVVGWGVQPINFFDAHCHLDRVLEKIEVKGAGGWDTRMKILEVIQGGG